MDTDLSWTLLGALVAHGTAGASDIDAAAAADPTASGERRATQLRALIPDPANKAAVWDRLIGDDGMANALQSAAIGGFAHPAQAELLAPFTERYFAAVSDVWDKRSIEVGKRIAVGLYPRWAVEQSTVDAALAWDTGEHPTALRRLVSEGRAGTERALRARRADAG
jgi:aminopeptidase N